MMPRLVSVLGVVVVVALIAETSAYSPDEVIRAIMKGDMNKRAVMYEDECRMEDEERQGCGRKTYDEMECRARGCCWEPCEGCAAEVPWCFLAKRMLREQCQVEYEQKDDCGYWGIPEGECYLRKCCYKPSTTVNEPWCFFPGTQMRLVAGDSKLSGRVEVFHDDVWGTVCDDNFNAAAARVVCRSLGHTGGTPRGSAHFGQGSGTIWLDGFRCTGEETRLEDCGGINWGRHDCSHSEDTGVECESAGGSEPTEEPTEEPIEEPTVEPTEEPVEESSASGVDEEVDDDGSGDEWLYKLNLQ